MTQTSTMIVFGVGAVAIFLAAHFGLQFYPPGSGYAEERRNNRIARVLLAVGTAAVGIAVWSILRQ